MLPKGGDGGEAPPPLPKRASREVAAQQPTAKLALMLGLPVQRVPQYGALLATLLKHTPAEHADFAKLNEAVAAMGVANAQIKDLVRERRRIEALLDVQNRFAAKHFPAKVRARLRLSFHCDVAPPTAGGAVAARSARSPSLHSPPPSLATSPPPPPSGPAAAQPAT